MSETPTPPDPRDVNLTWRAEPSPRGGVRGWVDGLVRRLVGRQQEAQRTFNSAQVQFDNALLAYLEARLAETHRHYDRILGETGQRQDEADERHRLLERELSSHVRDLVERIDLLLTESCRNRQALTSALHDVRERLQRMQERLRSREG